MDLLAWWILIFLDGWKGDAWIGFHFEQTGWCVHERRDWVAVFCRQSFWCHIPTLLQMSAASQGSQKWVSRWASLADSYSDSGSVSGQADGAPGKSHPDVTFWRWLNLNQDDKKNRNYGLPCVWLRFILCFMLCWLRVGRTEWIVPCGLKVEGAFRLHFRVIQEVLKCYIWHD